MASEMKAVYGCAFLSFAVVLLVAFIFLLAMGSAKRNKTVKKFAVVAVLLGIICAAVSAMFFVAI